MAGPFNILVRSQIARLLDVDDKTVSDYIEDSKPGRRCADDPVPEPAGYLDARAPDGWVPAAERRPGLRPFWHVDSVTQWQAWRERHPARTRTRTPHRPDARRRPEETR